MESQTPLKEIEQDIVAIDKRELINEIGIAIRQIKAIEQRQRFILYIIISLSVCLNIWLLYIVYLIK
jgi:hypothetical protein